MSIQTTNAPAGSVFDIRAVLRAIGSFLISLTAAARMSHEIERLMSMSDSELSRLGLRREEIVRHVFGMRALD